MFDDDDFENTMVAATWSGASLWVLLLVLLVCLAVFAWARRSESAECHDRGGEYVHHNDTYVCLKPGQAPFIELNE
jgi:hypothetical protein